MIFSPLYGSDLGLGDSSSFKSPQLPRFLYLFLAPVAVPVLAPIICEYFPLACTRAMFSDTLHCAQALSGSERKLARCDAQYELIIATKFVCLKLKSIQAMDSITIITIGLSSQHQFLG